MQVITNITATAFRSKTKSNDNNGRYGWAANVIASIQELPTMLLFPNSNNNNNKPAEISFAI